MVLGTSKLHTRAFLQLVRLGVGQVGMTTGLERPPTNKLAQVGELVGVLILPLLAIIFVVPLAGDDPFARHGVVLVANVLMLAMVWLGLRVRGQGCEHFGLSLRPANRRTVFRAVLQSFAVFVAAVAATVVGAVVMSSIFGRPEGADMSGFDYLHDNLPMLILVLVAVYFNASFGEEVIYRAFLINRIAELGSGSKSAWRLGVLISSLVFGLIHSGWGLVGMVQMTFMGLALAVSYLVVRRNLWVTILAHGYLDTILIVPMYFGVN